MTQEFTPEDRTKAANNILEDLMAEKEKSGLQCQAIFNIMEDVNIAREELRNKYQDFEILQGLTQTLGFSFDVRAIMSSISDAIRKLSFEITISYVLVPLYQESSPVIVIDTDEQIGDEYIESIYNSICLTLKTKPNIEKNSEMLRYFMPGSVGDKLPFEFSRGSKNPDVRACPQFQTNIPLVVPGALSGLINISSQNPNCISPERMHVVHMLVQNAAQTIERMRVLVSSEQSRLQDLLSNMTDGVLLFEENGHIVVTNPCFKTMIESGFEHHSVQTIIDVLENNQDEEIGYKRVKLTQIIQGIFQKAESIRIDLFCFKQRVYEVNIVPVKNNQRGVSGTALIFHDITDRRRVDNLKDQFLNTVSHELRTPLAIIKGAAG
ncbi:MAG: hypothetical protein HY072_02750, partial [Deltaproteobacteria bacterium]|nr:hypothetical protein [Deltaproteobacteria bacterium]